VAADGHCAGARIVKARESPKRDLTPCFASANCQRPTPCPMPDAAVRVGLRQPETPRALDHGGWVTGPVPGIEFGRVKRRRLLTGCCQESAPGQSSRRVTIANHRSGHGLVHEGPPIICSVPSVR